MAFLLQFVDLLFCVGDAFARIFVHRFGVQRDIRAAPRIRCWRQIIGIGFAGYFKHGCSNLLRYFGARSKPLSIRPALHYSFGLRIARFRFFSHIAESIKHQQSVFQLSGGCFCQLGVIQQLHQRGDVVTAQHGAQQFHGVLFINQRRAGFTFHNRRQKTGFDIGRRVNAGRHAMRHQLQQKLLFAFGRILQEINQPRHLLGRQWLRHNALSSAFFDMFTIGFKHGGYLTEKTGMDGGKPVRRARIVRNGASEGKDETNARLYELAGAALY